MPGSSIVASLILLFIPLTLLQRCGAADSIPPFELQSKDCSGSGNFSSDFEMNLRQFLAALPSNVIKNGGSFNGSVGSTDAVFGMAMCQADHPWPDHCESCLQAATAEAPKACPSFFNTSVAYRGCVLRYWDWPVRADNAGSQFIYVAFNTPEQPIQAGDNVTAIDQVRQDLFDDLSRDIVTSPWTIASGNRTFNSTHNFYGLAQCYRDWPQGLCSYYVRVVGGGSWVQDNHTWEGLAYTSYSFYMRYSLTPFQVYVPDNSSGPTETAKDVVKYKDCPSSGNATSSDAYQLNLRKFLDVLPSNAINNGGFFNGTTTGSENKVYGTAMCQADIPWPDQCKQCLQAASAGAPKDCPASSSASVAYQGCVLRYSDMPILADEEGSNSSIAFYTPNHAASVPDTTAFQRTRQDLLTDLAGAAVTSPMMIGSGNRTFNSTHNLYGLAQCNKDLPTELCSTYIQSVVPKLATDVQWSEGVSITGFTFYIRYDLTPFVVYVPTPVKDASPSQLETGNADPPSSNDNKAIIAGVTACGAVILVVVVVVGVVFRHCKDKSPPQVINNINNSANNSNNNEGSNNKKRPGEVKSDNDEKPSEGGSPTDMTREYLKKITKNFSELLGRGAFGNVYVGVHNGEKIAVKQIPITQQNVDNEKDYFKTEFDNVRGLKHRNIIKLIGYCNEDKGKLTVNNGEETFSHNTFIALCFEYMANGSLQKHLKDEPGGMKEWQKCYKIIKGICDGLKYLHDEFDYPIWHLDLKPANILLNKNFVPKIADFGTSELIKDNRTQDKRSCFKGTMGYSPPEYTKECIISNKVDIFSLGVVMMEIIAGTEWYDKSHDKNFIDKVLEKRQPQEHKCVKRCVETALKCLHDKPAERPKIEDIIRMLNETEKNANTRNTMDAKQRKSSMRTRNWPRLLPHKN